MSSKKEKKKKWADAVKNIKSMNSIRLQARLYSIEITKPAFRTQKQKDDSVLIREILKKRGIKFNPKEIFKSKRN